MGNGEQAKYSYSSESVVAFLYLSILFTFTRSFQQWHVLFVNRFFLFFCWWTRNHAGDYPKYYRRVF